MEFLGSNEEGMGVKGLYRGAEPVARGGRQAPRVAREWGPPVARGGGRQAPLSCLWAGATGRPGEGRQAPLSRLWAGPTGRLREGGDRPPLSPVGGATCPPFIFFDQGPRCKFEEKLNYI